MHNQHTVVARELVRRYRADSSSAEAVQCELNHDVDYLQVAAQFQKSRSHFRVVSIEPIDNELLPAMWLDIQAEHINSASRRKPPPHQLGIFKITFSDNSFFYCARYFDGEGRASHLYQLTAAEPAVWIRWLRLVHREHNRRVSIPKGVASAHWDYGRGLHYTRITNLATFPAIHPEVDALKADIAFFFDHVSQFTRYNQPGVRKALLVGPPGTGKTSMCLQLAREFQQTMSVVFSTDIKACAAHLMLAAKQEKAVLTILEDADGSLKEATSDVLNFLDGINQPVNPKGSFVVMTTNFPERIEPRILQRPGRIDRLYHISALTGNHALQCAELYFPSDLQIPRTTLNELVSGLTGAQIKELAQSSISHAISTGQPLTASLISEVKTRIANDLKQVYKYAEDHQSMLAAQQIGFGRTGDGTRRITPSADDEELPF
jgi:hypothetical protein